MNKRYLIEFKANSYNINNLNYIRYELQQICLDSRVKYDFIISEALEMFAKDIEKTTGYTRENYKRRNLNERES